MFSGDSLTPHSGKVLSLLRVISALILMQHGLQKIIGFPAPARGPFELMSQMVGSSRVDLQACKLEYSIVSPK